MRSMVRHNWEVAIGVYDMRGEEMKAMSGIEVPDRASARRVAQAAWRAGFEEAKRIQRQRRKPRGWFRLTGD